MNGGCRLKVVASRSRGIAPYADFLLIIHHDFDRPTYSFSRQIIVSSQGRHCSCSKLDYFGRK